MACHSEQIDRALSQAFQEASGPDKAAVSAVFASRVVRASVTPMTQDLFTHMVWLSLREGGPWIGQCASSLCPCIEANAFRAPLGAGCLVARRLVRWHAHSREKFVKFSLA